MATRNPPRSARADRAARQQAREEHRRARGEQLVRRRRLRRAGLVVGTVCVVLGAVVFLGLRWSNGSGVPTTPIDPAVRSALESVPSGTFDQVGVGKVDVRPTPLSGAAPLTANGKPRVLYVGAEFCPFCAAERWAVVVALSRFGTFHGLGQSTSSHADSYPDTPTLSFHGSTYHSKYLAFTGYERQSNQVKGTTYAPLDTLSAADLKVFDTYDGKPYLGLHGAIPFLDIGNKYLSQGASFSPGLLDGMTHLQIARAIADPSSSISQGVVGTANAISAALCTLTGNQPSEVCSSGGVTAAAATLDHS